MITLDLNKGFTRLAKEVITRIIQTHETYKDAKNTIQPAQSSAARWEAEKRFIMANPPVKIYYGNITYHIRQYYEQKFSGVKYALSILIEQGGKLTPGHIGTLKKLLTKFG